MEFLRTRTFRVLVLLGASLGLLWVVYYLRAVFTPLLLAFLLAYILNPVVDGFERLRLSRTAAIVVLYLVGIVVVAITVGGLFTFIGEQVVAAIEIADKGIDELAREPWVIKLHEKFSRQAVDPAVHADLAQQIKDNIKSILQGFRDTASYLQSQMTNLLNVLMYFLLVPLYTFFLLLNFDAIVTAIRDYLPGLYRNRIVSLTTQVHIVMSSFFRGRLVIAAVITLLSSLLFWATRCPLPFLFGPLVGIVIIIPFASILVVLVAAMATYFEAGTWGWAIAVFAVGLIVQAIEAYVLTPVVIGKKLELHFIVIILSVFVFGELFGFFGVLLSVPLAAVAKILGREFLLPTLKELAAETPPETG